MAISYELLGQVFVGILVIIAISITIAISFGLYFLKTRKVILPQFVLFVLFLFYAPTVRLFRILGLKESLVDEILIELDNSVFMKRFSKEEDGRIVLLPQCMRDPRCKAKCDTVDGYLCRRCGLCDIGRICDEADKRGFRVFIIPGGTFVRKIFKRYRPKACLAVACTPELIEGMQAFSKKIPIQCVRLKKAGCYMTEADVPEIIEKMELCGKDV